MKFAQPIWLLIGVAACAALLWRYRKFDQKQRTDLAKFASESLIAQLTSSVSTTRRNLKRVLVVGGVALLAVALARPLVGFRWEEAKRKGLDLLIAVDTSKSMLAQDVKPDRLTRGKMAVENLLQKLDGDRVGLIAFAGNAFLQCPLTLDYDAFRQSLEALDTGIIPRGGTDIAAAIYEAEAALENNGNNERILVLITDGEDMEGKALDAVRDAAKNGLKIFTVGVGSANGELIPVPDENGGTQFMKDASGQFAKSKLDESMLKQIAEAAGGIYQPLGQQAQGLETLYRDGLSKFTKHDITSRMRKVYLERFQWPLALGLLCLVLEPIIGIRKRRAVVDARVSAKTALLKPVIAKVSRRLTPAATVAAALALLALPSFAHASAGSAEKAYAKGQFEQAAHEYQKAAEKTPKKPELQFNRGAAAYKAGQHEVAAEAFAKAMKTDNVPLQQDNYYNLGNTRYRLGQKTEKSNPQETIKTWEEAVRSYEAALQLKTDDADAKYNRDLVKKKLEELKKQQEQQEQQEQQKQDQKQDQQNQQDQKEQKDQQNQDKQQNQDNKQNSDQKQDQKDQPKSGSGQDKQDQKDPKDKNKDEQKQNGSSGDQEKQDEKDQDKGQDQKDQKNKQDQAKGDKPEQKKNEQKDQQQANSSKPDEQKPGSEKEQKPEPGKGQKDQAGQQSSKPESKQDRANQKPELANQNAKPGEKKDNSQEEAEARRVPGKMSKQEAKQLLDSLKNGDRKMPVAPSARGQAAGHDDEPLKDW